MVLITTLALTTAINAGLGRVGKSVLEKGLLDPALKPVTDQLEKHILSGFNRRYSDRQLQKIVEKALTVINAPKDQDNLSKYLVHFGLDRLQAPANTTLRQLFAEATLRMTRPDPTFIPPELLTELRWPATQGEQLALFLYTLRAELEGHDDWGPLVQQADRILMRDATLRMVTASERTNAYLVQLLQARFDIRPDEDDGQAIARYQADVQRQYAHISFVMPSFLAQDHRRDPDFEQVFVSLQIATVPTANVSGRTDDDALVRIRRRVAADNLDEDDLLTAAAHGADMVTVNDVLSRYPVFLLIGKPGSGKTTLLRYLALCFAQGREADDLDWMGGPLLPILLPLRNFAHFLETHPGEYNSPGARALREFMDGYFRDHERAFPVGFFTRRLEQGNCLVMLDGLDEVGDRDLRSRVADFVNLFIQTYQEKGNRFALASRPGGYDDVKDKLIQPVVCTVQDLTPETRDRLVRNVCHIIFPEPHQLQEALRDLLPQIQEAAELDELSRNPLSCTTLVLVYHYGGARLPHRRVDVYQGMVELLLGLWATRKGDRERVFDAHRLVYWLDTDDYFDSEQDARDGNEDVLTWLAWRMQQHDKLTALDKETAITYVGEYLHREWEVPAVQKKQMARRFLHSAHERSDLFREMSDGQFEFSHKQFQEYLAATALLEQDEAEILQLLRDHAHDQWWEQVILLAVAHRHVKKRQRRAKMLEALLEAGNLLLAGRCAVDAGRGRLPVSAYEKVQQLLRAQMTDATLPPAERYAAGEVLDQMGWLPPDLHAWVKCQACADNKRDLYAAKYPVTNAQFALFIEVGGYENPAYWGGVGSDGWQWRLTDHPDYRGQEPVTAPEYWYNTRFGKERYGYPVVGVSWYEAAAYAAWLTELLARLQAGDETVPENQKMLVADLQAAGVQEVRLPTDDEWTRLAGNEQDNRYPWDRPGQPVTRMEDTEAIIVHANVDESGIKGTSPVGMYPQGASHPFGLMDMAGNVLEWTATWQDKEEKYRWVRGGSWLNSLLNAHVSFRFNLLPSDANYLNGMRVVAPVGS